jgi:hypothetical protein
MHYLLVMSESPIADSSLNPGHLDFRTVTPPPHNPALARLVSLSVVMLLVGLFYTPLFAQSEKLVWMKAANGRVYTTTCTAEHCEIREAAYAVDLVDPQYVHDRRQERKTFCKVKALKHAACYQAFSREETIQRLLYADRIVSNASDMSAMSREQAEQLIDEINKK